MMNVYRILPFMLAGVLIVSGCAASAPESSPEAQTTPELEGVPPTGYQPVVVDNVDAEIGVGSPIPVFATITGTLPDTCAQLELVRLQQDATTFDIDLSTIASSGEACIHDTIPFSIRYPLNVISLPAGSYSVQAGGLSDTFALETGNTAGSARGTDAELTKDDIQVDSVNVEVGVGSPIPVHAVVGLSLPNTCAQLGEIRLHREGTAFIVRLIAHTLEGENCITDNIPFRADIPLNIINLPEGPYEVNVNGVTASFDPAASPVGD